MVTNKCTHYVTSYGRPMMTAKGGLGFRAKANTHYINDNIVYKIIKAHIR